jgi:hypothetical protein
MSRFFIVSLYYRSWGSSVENQESGLRIEDRFLTEVSIQVRDHSSSRRDAGY